VRRFTSPMTRIIKLIPGDVDRPITDLAGDLDYPDMARDARKALDTPAFMEKEVDACDGRRFTVRIMPYRAWDKRIGGVVVAFIDVSVSRAREIKLREALPGRPKENP
jgi:two-component system, chemotaxis family, CheB/CheR fusion protein